MIPALLDLPAVPTAQVRLGGDELKIENYVTRKALDGLFLMIAEEERAIRKDPLGAATGLAKKAFGALGQ